VRVSGADALLGRLHPQIFVNTAAVGGAAAWAYDEPLADWDELQEFRAAGGIAASHGRGHPSLSQLAGSRSNGSTPPLGALRPPEAVSIAGKIATARVATMVKSIGRDIAQCSRDPNCCGWYV
jgi:hypothetical protein